MAIKAPIVARLRQYFYVVRHFKLDTLRLATFSLLLLVTTTLLSCDPVHTLDLENKRDQSIEICYYPNLQLEEQKPLEARTVILNGKHMNIRKMKPLEKIVIGTVVARYQPVATDIDLEYLEIRFARDTIIFKGKNAIFTNVQKVGNLDWRLIVK